MAPAERTWSREDVEQAVAESREKSGVPPKVEDPTVLRKLAALRRSRERKAS